MSTVPGNTHSHLVVVALGRAKMHNLLSSYPVAVPESVLLFPLDLAVYLANGQQVKDARLNAVWMNWGLKS